MQLAKIRIAAVLTASLLPITTFAQIAPADAKPAPDTKATSDTKTDTKSDTNAKDPDSKYDRLYLPQALQAFYLPHGAAQTDLNDVQTTIRQMVSRARIFAIPHSNQILVGGTQQEVELAQKVVASIDLSKRLYRITYTITDSEDGKRIGQQHFALIVASGGKTEMKQGSKVPILTGDPTQKGQIEYEEIGLNITASVDGFPDGASLKTKITESGLAEEKSGVSTSTGDPIIRETSLEGASFLEPGKPLVLGSLDLPGSTRHQEIEVVSELIH